MGINEDYHPDSVHHPDNVRRAKIEAAHLEALAENLQRDIHALVTAAGFELDVDYWGDGKMMLRHLTATGGYDYEIPLGESE